MIIASKKVHAVYTDDTSFIGVDIETLPVA